MNMTGLPPPENPVYPSLFPEEEDMRDFNDQARPPPKAAADHVKELTRLITGLSHRHSQWQVFSDFVEMGAISMSNAVDLVHRATREARYMETIKRYKSEELAKFPQMFSELVLALEAELSDVVGKVFHDLELHNKWAGQFFSPYHLCRTMAQITLSDKADIEAKIGERGFIRASEPCAGSGAMVIALADEMRRLGIDYQRHLHVTAVDVDIKCVHMAYLQFSLLHIPAVVVHGNSLSLEEFGHWHTPAHILDGWDAKLNRAAVPGETHTIEKPPEPEPPGAAMPAERLRDEDAPQGPAQLTLF